MSEYLIPIFMIMNEKNDKLLSTFFKSTILPYRFFTSLHELKNNTWNEYIRYIPYMTLYNDLPNIMHKINDDDVKIIFTDK